MPCSQTTSAAAAAAVIAQSESAARESGYKILLFRLRNICRRAKVVRPEELNYYTAATIIIIKYFL